jgi:hypothetical protein
VLDVSIGAIDRNPIGQTGNDFLECLLIGAASIDEVREVHGGVLTDPQSHLENFVVDANTNQRVSVMFGGHLDPSRQIHSAGKHRL